MWRQLELVFGARLLRRVVADHELFLKHFMIRFLGKLRRKLFFNKVASCQIVFAKRVEGVIHVHFWDGAFQVGKPSDGHHLGGRVYGRALRVVVRFLVGVWAKREAGA